MWRTPPGPTPATPTPKLRLLDDKATAALAKAEEACGEAAAELKAAEDAARRSLADWLAGKAPRPAGLAGETAGTISGELVRYAFDERLPDGKFASSLADDRPATSPAASRAVKIGIERAKANGRKTVRPHDI